MNLRNIIPVVIALLLGAAGTAMFTREKPLLVDWAIVSDRAAPGVIVAAGHVSESGIMPVYPCIPGTISSVVVSDGQPVAAGDTLVRLDDREQQAHLARCAVDVTIASLRLEEQTSGGIGLAREKVARASALALLAEKQHMRSDSLFSQGSIAQAELDEVKKELAIAQADRVIAETELAAASSVQVQLLQAALSQARLTYEDAQQAFTRTVVKAPVSGTILDLGARKGALVTPGQPLMRILSNDSSVTATVLVDETLLSRIRTGQKVLVECNRGVAIDAVVTTVVGRIDTATHAATVALSIKQTHPHLIAGQTVVARITSDDSTGAILLDRRFRYGTARVGYVFVKSGNRVVRRLVRSDDLGGTAVSIRSGISTGDTVVSAALLSESSSIRLSRKPVGVAGFP